MVIQRQMQRWEREGVLFVCYELRKNSNEPRLFYTASCPLLANGLQQATIARCHQRRFPPSLAVHSFGSHADRCTHMTSQPPMSIASHSYAHGESHHSMCYGILRGKPDLTSVVAFIGRDSAVNELEQSSCLATLCRPKLHSYLLR